MNTLQDTIQQLRKDLETPRWLAGTRIPSLQRLADRYAVSRTTMWKVVGILKRESLLHTRQRGMVIAGPTGSEFVDAPTRELGWERLRNTISSDLLAGVFGTHQLPPTSKLALRYHASVNTIRKALDVLFLEGAVHRVGRAFYLERPISGATRKTMVMISEDFSDERIPPDDQRLNRLTDSLERECSRLEISCRHEGFAVADSKALLSISRRLGAIRNVAGYVVSLWHPGTMLLLQRWMDLLGLLASKRLPVVVVDQGGELAFPDSLLREPSIRILRIAAERAGEEMAGRILAHKGARPLFISPFFGAQWAQRRYAGVQRWCRQRSGRAQEVDLFAHNEVVNQNVLAMGLLGVDSHELRALFGERLSADQLRGLEHDRELAAKLGSKPRAVTPNLMPIINRSKEFLLSAVKEPHAPLAYDTMLSALNQIVTNAAIESYHEPLFDRALRKGSGTTWICADDKTAIIALLYLRSKRIAVPEQITVCGFENWREGYFHQLSSYDFNMDGMAKTALQLILDDRTRRKTAAVSEVTGYVVERRTTSIR